MFKWEKLGRIFTAEGNYPWMNSHTTPVSSVLLHDRIRVFICTRSAADESGNFLSHTSFVDVDMYDPTHVLYIHDAPVLDLGRYGTFDEFGVMVTNAVMYDGKIYLYYAGWQRLGGGTAPYQVNLGLAVSDDDGYTFTKVSEGPIMSLDYYDPISIGNVAVVADEASWKLYYTSLTHWVLDGEKPTYEYVIKFAESNDGVFWKKENRTVVDMQDGFGVATPSVIKMDDEYHMWFGYRKAYDDNKVGGYRIGYASSKDGMHWVRDDSAAGLTLSEQGWDSQMVCYPDLLKVGSDLYMFYCGNYFGKDGFGVARLIRRDANENIRL